MCWRGEINPTKDKNKSQGSLLRRLWPRAGHIWSQNCNLHRKTSKKKQEKRQHHRLNRLSVAFELLHLLWGKPYCLSQYLHMFSDHKVSVSAALVWRDGLHSLTLADDFIWHFLNWITAQNCKEADNYVSSRAAAWKGVESHSNASKRRFTYVHQQSFSGWLMAIKSLRAV